MTPPPTAPPPAPVPVTHRRVLGIALPIVLSNATVPILGAVDTGVVGQLGEAAPIGAVGMGAIILAFFYGLFGFLRMGTSGLVAQAFGAGQREEVAAIFSRTLLLGGAFGLIILAAQLALFWAAFQVSPASAEVETLARAYLEIRVLAAPATLALYGITGWLIGLGRTRPVLVLQLWINGLNIGLDLWFVLGLGWGVEGVAWASLIAEATGLALGLWLCRDAFAEPAWRATTRVFDAARLRLMAAVNGDILIRSFLLQMIFISFLFTGSAFGDVPLAANQVLLQFLEITAFALDGFAFAAEAMVGQALGARDRVGLRRSGLLTSLWGGVVCLALALAFGLFGGAIIDLMTTSETVRAEARLYLPYMVAAPLLGLAPWMLDGIFIGATRTADMRNTAAISLVVYVLALAALTPWLDNHGIWLALLISFVARGVTLGLRYPALERLADPAS
ncbi:MAG: MATE family efflux transporter [Pseudomonadota bacterium]